MLHYLLFVPVILAAVWAITALAYSLALGVSAVCQHIVYPRVRKEHRKTCRHHRAGTKMACRDEIRLLISTKPSKVRSWLWKNKWITYWPIVTAIFLYDYLMRYVEKRIRSSAELNTRLHEVGGAKEVNVTETGTGRFLWMKRAVSFGSIANFERFKQKGPFADIWYLDLNGGFMRGGLARNHIGDFLFARDELLTFAQEINQRGAKTTMEGTGLEARFGSYWTIDLNRGIELMLIIPDHGGIQSITIDVDPGTSTVSYGFLDQPDDNTEQVDNTVLLEHLRALCWMLEEQIPSLWAATENRSHRERNDDPESVDVHPSA